MYLYQRYFQYFVHPLFILFFHAILWSFYLNYIILKTISLDLWPAVEDEISIIACRPYDLFL